MNTKTDSDTKIIETINEFVEWVQGLEGSLLLYRGLADSDWELGASGYLKIKRQIKPQGGHVPAPVFQNSIDQLLDSASLQGFRERDGREISDLELLADLQHKGTATCLIDFTTDPLIALWFACREEPEKNGKVCAMCTDSVESFSTVSYEKLKKPIKDFFAERKLWKWRPSGRSNRVIAQSSVFVFGKGEIEENYYETVEIKKERKEEILEKLKHKFGIDELLLFRDFTGFSLAHAHDKQYICSADDYFLFGINFHQKSEYEKAIAYYGKVIEINPRDAEAYRNRGNAKAALGNHQGAIEDYSKVIGINPQDAVAYKNRGNAKNKSGKYQDAIEDYSKVIGINPQDAVAYKNRGNAKAAIGNHQGAIEDYSKVIDINPQDAEAYKNRGNAKNKSGKYQDAIEDYSKVIDINPQDAEAYKNRGAAKIVIHDPQSARADYDKAIEINPQYAGAYYGRRNAKNDLGDHQGAQEDWDKAAALDPKFKKLVE